MNEQIKKENNIDEKVKKIRKSLENLNTKNFKVFIYSPDMKNNSSGGVGVLYQHVKVLRELGYDATILTEKNDYEYPKWLGDKYQGFEHVSLSKKNKDGSWEKTKLQVSPEDFLIIPEGFGNLLEQTQKLSCRRVVLAQSWAYILNSLMPGSNGLIME